MGKARDEAGNLWETDAQGNAVRLLQMAPQQGPQPFTIGAPDPTREATAAAQATRAGAEASAAVAEAPYAGTIAEATAEKARADAAAARASAAQTSEEVSSEQEKEGRKLIQRALQTDSVIEAINIARDQIGEGWATGNFFGGDLWQGVPALGQGSANLNATLSGLQGSIINDTIAQLKELSASGASGYGSLTETEANRLAAAVGALQQTQDAEALRTNLARVEKHYRNALALLNGEDPRNPEVAERYGVVAAEGGDDAPSDRQLTSEGKFERDPALAGANSTVRRMILEGASTDDIRSYLDRLRPGYGAQVQNIEQAVNYVRQNPNDERGFNVDVEKVWVPNSGITAALGDIGMSGPGAALIGAADTASLGTLDNIVGATGGNAEMARAAMTGVSEESPMWYLGGQIAGGATSGLGLEALLARGGVTGARAAVAGDALFGAGYGAGMADEEGDSRIAAALLGAGGGVAGGMAGRGLARGTGRALEGVQNTAQRALNQAGISMTPGQIIGGRMKALEDRLAGLPVVGDAIRTRRGEGLEDFNVAAFDEALAPTRKSTGGVTGAPGIDIARELRGEAYQEALDGVYAVADEPFKDDIASLLARSDDVREVYPGDIRYTLDTRIGNSFDDAGGISGDAYQQTLRGLRRDTSSVEKLPYGHDFATTTREAEGVLEALLDRQSPGTTGALRTANEVNRRVETLRDAVNRARNGARTGEVEIFAPSQLADAAASNARKYGNSQGTTNQPFYQLTRSAQEVLPSSIPDSGTAGRLVLPALVGATAGGGSYAAQEGDEAAPSTGTLGTAAIASLIAAAPYSKVARDRIQKILLSERPEAVEATGRKLLENAEIIGLLSRPAGTMAVQ